MIDLIQKLAERLQSVEGITAAILFGSEAQGKTHANSDIDIAVLRSNTLSDLELVDIQEDLSGIANKKVDCIAIGPDTSLILQDQIARHGKLLFSKNSRLTDEFFIRAPQLFADFMYYRKPLEESYKNRALRTP